MRHRIGSSEMKIVEICEFQETDDFGVGGLWRISVRVRRIGLLCCTSWLIRNKGSGGWTNGGDSSETGFEDGGGGIVDALLVSLASRVPSLMKSSRAGKDVRAGGSCEDGP